MAWTAPRTWVAGETVTAALLNTHLRDDMLETETAKVTTAGDVAYATAANALARLGIGTANKILRTNSGATAPQWMLLPDTIVILSGHLLTTSNTYTTSSPQYTHAAADFDIKFRSYLFQNGSGTPQIKVRNTTAGSDLVTHTGTGHQVSAALSLTAGQNYEIQVSSSVGGQQIEAWGELIVDVY